MFKVGKNENCEVVSTQLGTSGADQKQQIEVTFMDPEGDTITAYLFCTDAAWPYTAEKLGKMGWDPEARGYAFEELNEDPSPLRGWRGDIVCKSETYNGEAKLKVQFINALGETGGRERMNPGAAADFASRLRAKLGVSGRVSKGSRPRPADDIPF